MGLWTYLGKRQEEKTKRKQSKTDRKLGKAQIKADEKANTLLERRTRQENRQATGNTFGDTFLAAQASAHGSAEKFFGVADGQGSGLDAFAGMFGLAGATAPQLAMAGAAPGAGAQSSTALAPTEDAWSTPTVVGLGIVGGGVVITLAAIAAKALSGG